MFTMCEMPNFTKIISLYIGEMLAGAKNSRAILTKSVRLRHILKIYLKEKCESEHYLLLPLECFPIQKKSINDSVKYSMVARKH